MRHLLQQIFRSGKFVAGFSIFASMVLVVIIYPILVPDPPLEIIGQGTFFRLHLPRQPKPDMEESIPRTNE